MRLSRAAVCVLVFAGGCTEVKKELGLTVDITGEVKVDGTAPAAFDLELFAWADNKDAFDETWCLGEPGCLGRIDVRSLDTPADSGKVEWDGLSFTMKDVPADLLYVLRVAGDDPALHCSQDIVGFDERSKVVTDDSAIAIEADGDLDTFELPRPARIQCSEPLAEPTPPDDPVPSEEPVDPDATTPDGDISVPPTEDPLDHWTAFSVSTISGNPIVTDASDGSATSPLTCDSSFPPRLRVQATSTDTSSKTAYLRLQFGTDEDRTVQTIPIPMEGGVVDQLFALTGGFAVAQLDLTPELEGDGESHTITFCDRADPPVQELLAILSWSSDNTDVDLHIESDGDEVAWYSLSRPWGDLDIDDIDGHGPETFTSAPGEAGREYTVWAHYYSDHGQGPTTAAVRVVYVDSSTGETCDVMASQTLINDKWFRVGKFGPGLACP